MSDGLRMWLTAPENLVSEAPIMKPAGFIIGASETRFSGAVSHIRSPSDIAGVYAAVGAGAAAGNAGAGVITLTNEKGAILTLTASRVVGLIVNVDLSGMVVSLR